MINNTFIAIKKITSVKYHKQYLYGHKENNFNNNTFITFIW